MPPTLTFPVKEAPAKGANACNSVSTSCGFPLSSNRNNVAQVREVNVALAGKGESTTGTKYYKALLNLVIRFVTSCVRVSTSLCNCLNCS